MMVDSDYSGMSKPLERARRDADEAAMAAQVEQYGQTFFNSEEQKKLRADLRHSRVERAKQILQIYREIQLHGLVGDGDLSLDAYAERLTDLFFGEHSNGGH